MNQTLHALIDRSQPEREILEIFGTNQSGQSGLPEQPIWVGQPQLREFDSEIAVLHVLGLLQTGRRGL